MVTFETNKIIELRKKEIMKKRKKKRKKKEVHFE
jgi:hypothetical protein